MNVETMYEKMRGKLTGIIPDFEIELKAKVAEEIMELKEKKNAVILGHNYMEAALFHSVPDFTGDSLDLSRKAAATDKDIIVFCGVRFMAETAKILNPGKMVLLPSLRAGCSLAASITRDDVRGLKEQFHGVPVVTYVNTYAEVKAESDICCTSSNAKAVVESLNSDTVIFLPDEYLARNLAQDTGREITIFSSLEELKTVDKKSKKPQMIGWGGRCEVHEKFTVEDIQRAREQFPNVKFIAHPECSPEVINALDKKRDYVGSTNGMVKAAKNTPPDVPIVILSDCSVGDHIIAENPEANILRLCNIRCPYMGMISLEQTLRSLQVEKYQIEVPEEIRVKAERALRRMIEIG